MQAVVIQRAWVLFSQKTAERSTKGSTGLLILFGPLTHPTSKQCSSQIMGWSGWARVSCGLSLSLPSCCSICGVSHRYYIWDEWCDSTGHPVTPCYTVLYLLLAIQFEGLSTYCWRFLGLKPISTRTQNRQRTDPNNANPLMHVL